jgi:predicted kinase
MSTRIRRGEPIPELEVPAELSDAPIRRPRKITASVPGTEYVTDPSLPQCETDADGLKGETFLRFVYNQLKSGTGVEKPTVYIMMGPPGAGKSTIKKTFNIENYINIDLDEIKKIIVSCFRDDPSTKGFAIIGNLKRFAKQLLDMAIREKMNVLFDTTGRMTGVVENVLSTTIEAGYKQTFVIVYTSLENCLLRASARNSSEIYREPMSSRMVSEAYQSFIEKAKSKGIISYYLIANPELTEHADELYVFDNNGPTPEIIFKRVNGVVEIVKETPIFYNMSINSQPPYFRIMSRGGKRTKKRRSNKRRRTCKRK